jgi:hypothetical protein
MESQHALVKLHVPRVYFDDKIGASANTPRIDVSGVEQCRNDWLGPKRLVYGEPREFADAPIRPAK